MNHDNHEDMDFIKLKLVFYRMSSGTAGRGVMKYLHFMHKHTSPRFIASGYLCHGPRITGPSSFSPVLDFGPGYAAARHGFHYGSSCSVVRGSP